MRRKYKVVYVCLQLKLIPSLKKCNIFSYRCLPIALSVACLLCSRPTLSEGKAKEARLDLQAIFTLGSTIRRKEKSQIKIW